MKFIFVLRKITAVILAAFMFLFAGSNHAPAHTVLDEDECRMCVAVLSDVHIEGNNLPRYNAFARILKDAKNNSFGNDAAVFLGDNTMNGQNIESMLFYGATAKAKIADNVFTVCGNHDVGNGEGDYDELCERYLNYNNTFLKKDLSKPYYYEIVNGYYFIMLAPEELCVSEFPISDEQLEFLDETLSIATKDGKPAFVCAHHPYYYTDGDEIEDILTKYDNVFYLAGHTHFPCCEGWTFNQDDGINEVNLPRCTELTGENDRDVFEDTGYAVQLEVYDDEVVGRVRNYYTGEWDDSLEYHFELVK